MTAAWVEPVESEAVAAIGHDPARAILLVRFTSGETYAYFDVPADLAAAFLAAESKGRFFHEAVFDRFAFERLEA